MKEYKGKISVIVPAFNEEQHITDNVKEIIKVLDEAADDYEIIIVDDGSRDETYENALAACSHLFHVQVVKSDSNLGKGNALKYGFQFVDGDLVAFLDADLDLPPIQILTLFNFLVENEADIAIGSKRHPNSMLEYPSTRKLMSNAYFYMIKILFRLPIRDTQTGIKLFKHEVLQDVFPRMFVRKYAFDLELLAIANRLGYEIVEAPVLLNYQRGSRMRIKDITDFLIDTGRIFYRMYLKHDYDKRRDRKTVKKQVPANEEHSKITETEKTKVTN